MRVTTNKNAWFLVTAYPSEFGLYIPCDEPNITNYILKITLHLYNCIYFDYVRFFLKNTTDTLVKYSSGLFL